MKRKTRRSSQERANALSRLLTDTGNVATKRHLVDSIIDKIGGIDALATTIAGFATDPNCPPSLKTKIYELIVRCVGEAEDVDPVGPEDILDTEDLELMLRNSVRQLEDLEGKADAAADAE